MYIFECLLQNYFFIERVEFKSIKKIFIKFPFNLNKGNKLLVSSNKTRLSIILVVKQHFQELWLQDIVAIELLLGAPSM